MIGVGDGIAVGDEIGVVGATGQLGSAFLRLLGDRARPVTRADLDLATLDRDRFAEVVSGAELVINCAAYTAVDRAQSEEELATLVNGVAVGMLAEATAAAGTRFVTFSTDYVFAGDATRPYLESDPTAPINAYGRSKLAGEQAALEADPQALVVRTSWVVSPTHPNFVATMLRLAGEGRALTVVDDQRGSPTMVDDLAAATMAAVEAGVTGLLHLTNSGETTWFELAREALEEARMDPGLISPCATADYPTPAPRPAYSVLGSEVRPRLGLDELPHWRESLPAVVSGLLQAKGRLARGSS